MTTATEALISHVVGSRLELASRLMLQSSDVLRNYVGIGCPPQLVGTRRTPEANNTPSLLEQSRQLATRACINVEAAMLAIMTRPVRNTGSIAGYSTENAVKLSKSIARLPAKRRRAIKSLLKARKLLDDANHEIILTDDCVKRVELRLTSQTVDGMLADAMGIVDGVGI